LCDAAAEFVRLTEALEVLLDTAARVCRSQSVQIYIAILTSLCGFYITPENADYGSLAKPSVVRLKSKMKLVTIMQYNMHNVSCNFPAITGSTACSAKHWYLTYSEGDFESKGVKIHEKSWISWK